MADYTTCPEVLKQFLIYMETIKNLSPRTIDGYFIDLRLFFRFLKKSRGLVDADLAFEEIDIQDITLADVASVKTDEIYEYLHFINRSRENNANTRSRKVSSLRSFYKYLTAKTHQIAKDPVKDLEVPTIKKSLPKFLTLDEAQALLRSPEGDFAVRDYCILTLFLNCGMRLSELVGINLSDLREDMINITGKGNKERLVYLNDACIKALEAYRKDRDTHLYTHKDDKALFLSSRGTRLSARRVEQIVDENLKRAGLAERGFSAHKLRHTAATLMYRYGNVDMLALKEILGHEHVSTTEIYTHISDQQLRDAVSASPLSGFSEPPKRGKKKGTHGSGNDEV